MLVSIQSANGLERQLKVLVPREKMGQEVDKKLKSLSKTVRLNGFRPGKIPVHVIQQKYGAQIWNDVMHEVLESSFLEAIDQEKLRPAGKPEVEFLSSEQGKDLEYTAKFDIFPEVMQVNLAGMQVEKLTGEVTEADVDQMIEALRKQQTYWVKVLRPTQQGDKLTVDLAAFMNGEPFEKGSSKQQTVVLGSGDFIDGFEDGLIGKEAGETVALDLRFPEAHQAKDEEMRELSGKDVHYSVQIQAVMEPRLPETTPEFIKSFGVEDGTVDSMRQAVRTNMERELAQALRDLLKRTVFNSLLAQNPIPVPSSMVKEEAERLSAIRVNDLLRQGVPPERINLTPDIFHDIAERRTRQGILMSIIIRDNNIRPDPQKVHGLIQALAATYEDPDSVVQWILSNKEKVKELENSILEEQVVDWVLTQKEVEIQESTSDFTAIMAKRRG